MYKILNKIPKKFNYQVAQLYYTLLHKKLSPILGNTNKAIIFLSQSIVSDRAFVAVTDEKVVGILDINNDGKSLFEPELKLLFKIYSIKAIFVIIGLKILSFATSTNTIAIDWLVVSKEAQGQGIGTALIKEAQNYAKQLKKQYISLYVINTNTKAQRLYHRLGFFETRDIKLKLLRFIFNFQGIKEMRKYL